VKFRLEEVAYRVLPRVEPGRALAHAEWLVIVKAAEVFLDGAPVPVSPETVADNVERFLVRAGGNRAWRIRALCVMVELLPLSVCGRRFTQLSIAERRRLVEERMIAGGRLWSVVGKIRFIVRMGAYGDARAANAETGFVPIPLRRRFRKNDPQPVQIAS